MNYKSRKYNINEEFFKCINTEQKAYVLGYLYADGCVTPPYIFSMASKDKQLLKDILGVLESFHPITKPNKGVYTVTVGSKQMVTDLEQHGCIHRKSWKELHIPHLEPNLIHHFIRGYFDGDGGVRIGNKNNLRIKFVGCKSLITEIEQTIYTDVGLKHQKIAQHSSIYRVCYSGNHNGRKLRRYLYKDATIYVDRKKIIFYSVHPKYKDRRRNKRTTLL